MAVVRVLLPGPGGRGAQTVRRSLCRRDVLADSRRDGGRVAHGHRRVAGHCWWHLLLVRHPVDRCAAGDLDDLGGMHQPGHVRARPDRLHLRAPLGAQGLPGRRTGPPGRFRPHQERSGGHHHMTMDSTVLSAELTEDATRYPLDPLSGAEIEAAAAVITGSDYATPTLKFVMISLAEPAKNADLTFAGAQVARQAFATMYD